MFRLAETEKKMLKVVENDPQYQANVMGNILESF